MTTPELTALLESLNAALRKGAASPKDPEKGKQCGEWSEAVQEAIKRLAKREDRASFTAPTENEVEEVMREKGLLNGTATEQARLFVAHHATRGWKLNHGLPMVSWRKAIDTWLHNYRTRFGPLPTAGKRSASERIKAMGIG